MRDLGVTSIPICGWHGRFLGTLSDRDIVVRCVAAGLDPTLVRVGSLVDGTHGTIDPEQPADDRVLGILIAHADGLPVVQKGRPVGMLGLVQVAGAGR